MRRTPGQGEQSCPNRERVSDYHDDANVHAFCNMQENVRPRKVWAGDQCFFSRSHLDTSSLKRRKRKTPESFLRGCLAFRCAVRTYENTEPPNCGRHPAKHVGVAGTPGRADHHQMHAEKTTATNPQVAITTLALHSHTLPPSSL
jgi:hypothetical protein